MASFLSSILVLIVVVAALFLNPLECKHNGFTVDLIRHHQPRNSISSADSSNSHFEWLAKSFERSFSRANYLKHALISTQSSKMIDSRLTGLGGEYVMEVYIGTPAVKIAAIADTGSDVSWTQCKPCINCYKQNDPLFDTNKTSSYRQLLCDSQQCNALSTTSCDGSNKCSYELNYGDKSQSIGDLAVETFSFAGSNYSFPDTVFGCGHNNVGSYNETASGIIGLGGGQLSIVNQFSKVITKKFSYCLVPEETVPSKISFGVDSIPKQSKYVSTPLIKGSVDTYYYITLESVSVVGTRKQTHGIMNNIDEDYTSPALASAPVQEGNIIIDSGTTLTILPTQIYQDLKAAILGSISEEPSKDPSGIFDICYGGSNVKFPDLVFHFKGADVVIPSVNSFLEVSRDLVCLAMVPTVDLAIFGNLSQMNFLVEYDIENQKLSFLPTDCTKPN